MGSACEDDKELPEEEMVRIKKSTMKKEDGAEDKEFPEEKMSGTQKKYEAG